jgi:thiol-disulfide isomerase/thioredoxin
MTKLTLCSLALLSVVALVGAVGQKTTQATLLGAKDRLAAPSFRFEDTSGKRLRLADFQGKPVAINLWATTCGGCIAELPEFVKLSEAYKNKGLTVIGISLDIMYEDLKTAAEGWAHVKPFIATHGIKYLIVLDDGSAEKAFNVTALPATYLVDHAGRLAATYIGVVDAGNLETNVEALLAER